MHIPAVFIASRTSQSDPMGRRGGGSMIFIHLDPTGHNTDGKVVDLTLTYHLPGSTEQITQTVTLAYPNDPSETPAETYLSAPEMAERYAMYNMFLGFRTATQSQDYNCAVVALDATRTNAEAWNATHEDPDITADLALLDKFVANLDANSATADATTTFDSCTMTNPYGDTAHGKQAYDFVCSSGGRPSGWIVVALAGLLAVRRRRR
jgi:MYXO-CTERM domain-containing protein